MPTAFLPITGCIYEIKCVNDLYYKIISKNVVFINDKIKIDQKLKKIQTLDRKEIRKKYRELRRSGKHTHDKGGGIGMYEIAKASHSIKYNFEKANEDKYHFIMESIIEI